MSSRDKPSRGGRRPMSEWADRVAARSPPQPRNDITAAEVGRHATASDGWVILRGKVYDVTDYMHYHPGGVSILRQCLGRDATKLFNRYHPRVNLDRYIGSCLLGTLGSSLMPAFEEDEEEESSEDEVGYKIPH